ncbi:MAG: hypothetical protein Q7R57_07115, partial [Dehalococcoidales bacterium]|nr:hypothetical protein [Dehalococcoidales bacterium]
MTDKQEELPAEGEAQAETEASVKNDPRDAIIGRLEQALAGKDSEISVLKQQLGETEKKLDSSGEALAQAV